MIWIFAKEIVFLPLIFDKNPFQVIKKLSRIVLWSILTLCFLVLSLYFLLELPPVQQKIKEFALQEITKKTQSKISIGNLRFRPFNRLQLEGIYAADLRNDTVFYAEKLTADFNFFKLLRKQFIIHSVEIDNYNLCISKDSLNAPFNFQFLLDAFASDTTQATESSNLRLAIDHILLKDGRLRYDIFSEPFTAEGLFDANHIDVQNLQLDAGLHFNSLEDCSGSINNLSFDEKSGFALTQLKFQVKNANNRLLVDRLHLSLPHSEGEIKEATFDYTGLQLNEILSASTYSVLFTSGKWYPADFACFYPELAHYPDTVICSGEIKGKFPEISLPHFELNYGKQLQLTLSAGITDYNAWETSAFELNVEKCSVDPKLFDLPLRTNEISLTGKIAGSLPDLKAALTAKSEQINLTVNGTGGYIVSSGNACFDLKAESSLCNLKNLLSDSDFGNTSFRLATQGTITGSNKISAKADAEIRQFDFKGYGYKDITANASYANDSISIDLISKDSHMPLTLHGKAGLNEKNQFAEVYAKLNNVCPDVLNLLPEYQGSKLSGSIHATVKGFDPELTTASIAIDDLHWITQLEDFTGSPTTISYIAGADRQKQLTVRSPMLNVRGKGNFTYDGIIHSFSQAFPVLFSSDQKKITKETPEKENFDFVVGIHQANAIARLLGMETNIPDSALFICKYDKEEYLNLNVTAFCIFNQTDTARAQLDLSDTQDDLLVRLDVNNKSNQYELEGNMGAAVQFISNPKELKPDVNIALDTGSLTLNGTTFRINPAQIMIKDKQYEINNFALQHSASEYLKIDGTVSDNAADSLQIIINRFEIGTIMSALKTKVPLSGTASGDITLSRLMEKPLVFARNFTIDNMVFDENPVGNLQLKSAWSSERQGLALRATWTPPDAPESTLSGFVLPEKDSLALTADIRGIRLNWLGGYLSDSFAGLNGELGAKIKINGKVSNPTLSGMLYLNGATVDIPMLNTKYRITDSIAVEKDQIVFKDCKVYDETNRYATINGSILHKQFSSLTPKLTIDLDRFLVLNNSEQTDSLFYGLIRLNGNLSIVSQNRDWLIKGNLSNGTANKIMVNLPESALEAQRYNWLTFVNTEKKDSIVAIKKQTANSPSDSSFPLKLQITLSVDPNLSVGAVINPDTKDAATVTGRGILDLSYSLTDAVPRLLGNYVINDGKCTLSLKNITKKTFLIQPGGKLNFQGDPMNTTFDLTAMYSLRAYLTSLDPSFATIAGASKIPVNCLLTASGKLENIQLKYRIELPNQTDEIQRKLDGLIYSDEIRIKEIAYLLAFGSFLPANSNSMNMGGASIWTSLASASITTQLNNLLSGVLSDNWTIGTDLHSNDSNFSNVDMDVNISTRVFNDRLTINGTLGYHNNTDQMNNFTGDFNLEYKLTQRGNVLLQFYNVTNNQYYDKSKAPLTQGVGIVYKREGRTFQQLFRSLRIKKK